MGLEFHVCTINTSAHTKKKSGNLFNDIGINLHVLSYSWGKKWVHKFLKGID